MVDEKNPENETEDVSQSITEAAKSVFDDGEYDGDTKKSIIGLEGDGDFFWVIQSFFWSIIKFVGVFGIMALLLWLIWGSPEEKKDFINNNLPVIQKNIEPESKNNLPNRTENNSKNISEEENIPQEDSDKKPTGFQNMIKSIESFFGSNSKKDINKNLENKNNTEDNSENNPNQKTEAEILSEKFKELKSLPLNKPSVENMAFDLEKNRVSYQEDVFFQSIVWLRKAKNLGEISSDILRIGNPVKRSKKIEEALVQSDVLFKESHFLQRQLQGEINELLKLGKGANDTVGNIEKSISNQLKKFNPTKLATLLQQKISVQKKAVEYLSSAKLRNTLLQNIQTFDGLLRKKSIPLLMPARISPAKKK